MQETFAAVWRSARTYKPDRGAGRTLALRGRAQRDRRPEPEPERAAGRGARHRRRRSRLRPSAPRRRTSSWRVHRALESLSPNERDVIELAYYGEPFAERGRRLPRHPARYGEDADTRRARPARRPARRGAAMTRAPDFDELIGSDVPARSARACGVRTSCSSRPGRRPSSRRSWIGAVARGALSSRAHQAQCSRRPLLLAAAIATAVGGRLRARPGDGSELDVAEHRTRRASCAGTSLDRDATGDSPARQGRRGWQLADGSCTLSGPRPSSRRAATTTST